MTASDPFAAKGMMRVTNGWFDLMNPTVDMVELDDIVMALSRTVRFTGHSEVSVLSHQMRAYSYALLLGCDDERSLRTVLMHDAHEAYVTDLSNPMKMALRLTEDASEYGISTYDRTEKRVEKVVAQKFDLIWPHPEIVHICDRMALSAEVEMTWGPKEVEAWGLNSVAKQFHFQEGRYLRQKYVSTVNLTFERQGR